jgi:hypothetical protein
MQVRVPRIVRDALDRNPDYSAGIKDALSALASEIEADAPLPAPRPPAPDVETWASAHAEHAGESWLHGEWFHAELAVYREIASRCRFWETERDPFAPAKEEELRSERLWTRLGATLSATTARDERVNELLEASLWGNRVDLSYSVAASLEHGHEGDLLADDRALALPFLLRPDALVHYLADNTGTELAIDLALVGALLESPAARVVLHVKMQPVFVSDAITGDVWRMLAAMRDRGGDARVLAGRLHAAFDAGRLVVAPDPYWSGPRFLWEAPQHLARVLRDATIVVLKGDANYRRLVGDAIWPPSAPFARAASFMGVPVVCARTMKSDSVLGLPAGLAEKLDAGDAGKTWRIDGKRGVVQAHVG